MPLFTAENAASMGRKGSEARWMKQLAGEAQQNSIAIAAPSAGEEFKEEAITRVRKHVRLLLDKIDSALESKFIDSKELREMATALKDLEGVEARLSNRPAPGNLRPVAQTKPKRSYSEPIPQPEPVKIAEPGPTTPQPVVCDPFSEVQIKTD